MHSTCAHPALGIHSVLDRNIVGMQREEMRVHALYSKDGSCKDMVVVPKQGRPQVMSEQNETALATWLIMCTRRDHSITKKVATRAANTANTG